MLPQFYIDDIIKNAIKEDINYLDVATDYLLDNSIKQGYFVAKDDGVICGIDIAVRVFELVCETFTCEILKKDGDTVKKGDIIANFSGGINGLLKAERTALNLLCHLSGVATATNKCVKLVSGTNADIVDTRKTIPTLRALQKYAVVCGGGKNHRFNLSDAAMLKDNHIDAYGSIENAVKALKSRVGHMVKIEVEARNLEEVSMAVNAKCDVIMLDNMTYDEMREAVNFINKRAVVEASGNITDANIAEVAKTGVDIISLGALTHSVKCFDISMKIKK